MIINYYDLYYTVINTRGDNEIVNNNVSDNDTINSNDIIIPNHYVGIKPRENILR